MDILKYFWIRVGIITVVIFTLAFASITYIDQHEFAYKVERMNGGRLTVIPAKGYVVVTPLLTSVYKIDLRPRQVCQTMGRVNAHGKQDGVNSRVLNCKLVQFNPDGLQALIDWHGVQTGDISPILGIYAYDQLNRPYPFLTIKEQSAPQEQKK